MSTQTFGVIRKDTGLWFGGFAPDRSVLWVEECDAKGMRRDVAQGQAALLIRFENAVQRKPVALS